jgi:hypothetical protein
MSIKVTFCPSFVWKCNLISQKHGVMVSEIEALRRIFVSEVDEAREG